MSSAMLTALDANTYFFSPLQRDDSLPATGHERDPSLILICGWMEAKLAHVEKYCAQYARLYPHASQLVVRCHPSFFFKSKAAQRQLLAPAVLFLMKEGYIASENASTLNHTDQRSSGILVHAFSNGGAYVLSTLSTALAAHRAPASASRIPNALVLDSTPGTASPGRTMAAFTAQMRSPFLRYPANVLLCLIYAVLYLYHFLTRTETLVEFFRRTLLSPALLPWTSKDTPRLYIYSPDDLLVGSEDIKAHIEDAKKAGYRVSTERYAGSAHVAHMRADPTRYWAAVQALWDSVSG